MDVTSFSGILVFRWIAPLILAFNSIIHSYLIKKLESHGLSESALKILSSYLQNMMQQVKNYNKYSTWKHIKCGIP